MGFIPVKKNPRIGIGKRDQQLMRSNNLNTVGPKVFKNTEIGFILALEI